MAISKILDFSAGSKFAIKLPQDIGYDPESQNCDWVLFSATPLLNLADSLRLGRGDLDPVWSVQPLFWTKRLVVVLVRILRRTSFINDPVLSRFFSWSK